MSRVYANFEKKECCLDLNLHGYIFLYISIKQSQNIKMKMNERNFKKN